MNNNTNNQEDLDALNKFLNFIEDQWANNKKPLLAIITLVVLLILGIFAPTLNNMIVK